MQSENRILDDLARMASGALSTLGDVRQELEARIRDQVERVLDRMEVVRREEFEAVRAMAMKARAEQERLAERVAALEARLAEPRHGAADRALDGSEDPHAGSKP
jgi:BMFP domain-containing protein YqiC